MQDALHTAAALAGDLPGLLLEAERVAHTFMKGAHGRRRVGQGETFWQFRHYAPGDSARDIDWKQTAKRDDAYVRELEWEAAQTLWLWRDASASMDFSSSKKLPSKRHQADVLLLALAMLALNGGEQAGLLGTDLAPQSHYNSIRRIYEYLPRQREWAGQVTSRSHAVIFSDFYFDLKQLRDFCESLAARQVHGILVQLYDPAEKTLPWTGRVKFHDVENTSDFVTLPQVESLRSAYEEKFIAHQQKLSETAGSTGWKFRNYATNVSRETILADLWENLAVEK